MSATWHPADGSDYYENEALAALDRAAPAPTDAFGDARPQALAAAQVYATLAVAQEIRALHDLLDAGLMNLQAAIEGSGDGSSPSS